MGFNSGFKGLIRDGESNKAEKITRVMRFEICSVHQILGWSNQEGWDGRGTYCQQDRQDNIHKILVEEAV